MRVPLPIVAFAAVIAARVPVVLAHLDTWYPIEIHTGNIAIGFLHGLDMPLGDLPIMSHIRAPALLGALLAPLYAAFGASSLVMKLLPLAWHAATVALLASLLQHFVSRRTAVVATLLFVLAPPTYVLLSVMALGSHAEAALPTLLCLAPFFALSLERRFTTRTLLAFGLALGFAAAFHLQALLAGAIMAGLLVLGDARRLLSRKSLAVPAGFAVGASPALLFEGLDLSFLHFLFLGRGTATGAEIAAQTVPGQHGYAEKIDILLQDGLAPFLATETVGPVGAVALGRAFFWLLMLAAGFAVWDERKRLGAALRRLAGRRDAAASPIAFFVLHPLVVLALLIVSRMSFQPWVVSSGVAHRRLVPVLFSLLVLAAFGISGPGAGARPRRLVLLLVPLLALGAAGWWTSTRAPEAARLAHRGECLEWFTQRLDRTAGGDFESLARLIADIDQGDPRFRTLRFRMTGTGMDSGDPLLWETEARLRATLEPELALYRATMLGRHLAGDVARLAAPHVRAQADGLPRPQREAFFHGVGLATPMPRGRVSPPHGKMLAFLGTLFGADDTELLYEGFGFARGFAFEPYSPEPLFALELDSVPAPARSAALRGFGWGYAQRYAVPPTAVPQGLAVLDLLPRELHADFIDGYLARTLPAEAEALTAR